MTLSLRSLIVTSLLSMTLALSGCGSSSKKASDDSNASVSATEDMGSSLEDIQLNADSDSGKAGPLKTVYFAFNSSTLSYDTREALNNNAEFLKANSSVKVEIEGHCDERGSVQYNLALGERRAKAVRDYMIAMGVEGSRMTTISFGKERPIAFGHDESAWNQNRRANFVVTAK